MMAIIIKWVFAIKLAYAMAFSLLVSIIYLIKGGFRSDVRVNISVYYYVCLSLSYIAILYQSTLGGFDYLNADFLRSIFSFREV
ncbi:MAG: hypothetical protein R2942_16715 [Ignavibacteria bacterium]